MLYRKHKTIKTQQTLLPVHDALWVHSYSKFNVNEHQLLLEIITKGTKRLILYIWYTLEAISKMEVQLWETSTNSLHGKMAISEYMVHLWFGHASHLWARPILIFERMELAPFCNNKNHFTEKMSSRLLLQNTVIKCIGDNQPFFSISQLCSQGILKN